MFRLRDYQEKAVEAVLATWETHSSALVVLPTGCGKTVVFGALIRRLLESSGALARANPNPGNCRVLVLAHRQELIYQARDKVAAMTGETVEIEMADLRSTEFFGTKPRVVVSTVQTQLSRREKFDPEEFSAVIIDEAHHATSPSYRDVIDYYRRNPSLKILGVTATPDRADEAALGSVFETVAYEYSHAEATEDGWLVPVRQEMIRVDSLDFSHVSETAGDLNSAELAEVMEDEKNLHAVAAPVTRLFAENERAIIFATSVHQAERLAEILNRASPVADFISANTPKDERKAKLDTFKRGELKFMVNVGILTEGFDDAGVTAVVMARPTQSRALYAQMVGRATRPAAEVASRLGRVATSALRRDLIAASSKPCCRVIDFVGNSGRHKLVSAVDILGGKDLDEEVKEVAKRRIAEKGGAADVAEELEAARDEVAESKRKAAARRVFIQATAAFTSIAVDPFNIYDLPPPVELPPEAPRHLSYKQREILAKLKVDPDSVSFERAKQLIDEYFRRMKAKEASLAQSRFLRSKFIPVPMSREEANRTITRLIRR